MGAFFSLFRGILCFEGYPMRASCMLCIVQVNYSQLLFICLGVILAES